MSRRTSRGKRNFMKAQPSQPRMPDASGPYGTRAAFTATDVAARAVVKMHATHNASSTMLQQSL